MSANPVYVTDPEVARVFNAANDAFQRSRYEDALGGFDRALSLHPTLVVAQLGRARCLVKLGEWMRAREAFAAVLRLEPSNYSAWLEAGHLCRQMGELQQAIGAYDRAINAAPTRYEAPLAKARVLEQMGQLQEGAVAYERAQRAVLEEESPAPTRLARLRELHQLMARYRMESGAAERAIQSLKAALATAERGGGRHERARRDLH